MSDFQKRDYELTAEVLKVYKQEVLSDDLSQACWEVLVELFVQQFMADNDRFDVLRFRKACGWEEEK